MQNIVYINLAVLESIAQSNDTNAQMFIENAKFVVFGDLAKLYSIEQINQRLLEYNESFDSVCIGRCPRFMPAHNVLSNVSTNKTINKQATELPGVTVPLGVAINWHINNVIQRLYDESKIAIVMSDLDDSDELFAYQLKYTIDYANSK
jgi:hypothetical protein